MPSRRNGPSQTSTQESTTQGDEEQRFAELLRPIKDLTANWNVPLSEYLETYYEELTELQIDIDGQTTRVNFAEAALLLQGTANVYSKKVEFLWLTVTEMMKLLSKKTSDDENANVPGGKKQKKTTMHDTTDFSPIRIDIAKNIDLKPDRKESSEANGTSSAGTPDHHQRKVTLKFIFVTPRQLIERGTEGKEMKAIRVNLYVPPSGNSSSSTKYDLIGHKEDFRVNMQFALGTAMIGEELSHQSDLGQQSVSLCEEDSILDDSMSVSLFEANPTDDFQRAPSSKTSIQPTSTEPISGPSSEMASNDGNNATSKISSTAPSIENQSLANGNDDFDCISSNNDVEHEEFDGIENNIEGSVIPSAEEGASGSEYLNCDQNQTKRTRRTNKPLTQADQMAPLADPWEPITPHEAANTIPKPIRRGRTRRAPTRNVQLTGTKSRPKKNSASTNEQERLVPVQDFMIQQMSGGKNSLNGPRFGNKDTGMAAELQDRADCVEKERKRKAALENKLNNNIPESKIIKPAAEQREDEDNHDDNAWNDANDPENDVDFDDYPMPDPHEGGITALVPEDAFHEEVFSGEKNAADDIEPLTQNGVDSYEELVMKRVAEFVAQSQDYIESTDLAKRVAKWHESIGPRLDAVEKRGNFDIHQYGSKILDHFPDGNAKTTVLFQELVQNEEREEVARYFLSSLMLANTHNVEVSNVTPGYPVMDEVELTLLSKKRHHEHMFQEEEIVQSKKTNSPKRKGKPRQSSSSKSTFSSNEDDMRPTLDDPDKNEGTNVSNQYKLTGKKRKTQTNSFLPSISEDVGSDNGAGSEKETDPIIYTQVQSCSVSIEKLNDATIPNRQTSQNLKNTAAKGSENLRIGLADHSNSPSFKIPSASARKLKPCKRRKL